METLFGKFKNIISKYDRIIIMSHQNPDLDAIGSSMGLSIILNKLEKDNYIFLSKHELKDYNNSVRQAIELVPNMKYVYPDDYKNILDSSTALIVLDVHQKERVEYPSLVDEIDSVLVIDHHIKNNSFIKDTELFYIDSTLSSMVELISEWSKEDEIELGNLVSTVMLAGMEVDTNGFNLKTTENTFVNAAHLTSMGADAVAKQNLLKETKHDYLKRADYIKNSYVFHKRFAICILTSPTCSQPELAELAAQLLSFEYIEASFAIGQLNSKLIGISARSIGDFDVCSIMKRMGGGGHLTNAASQIPNSTVKEIERELKKILGEFE